jgi:Mrp family chromosome partitioning ATPase
LSDASIMASKVDGTLVVVDITRARKESLKQVKALLAQAGTCVLGCVINKQRRSRKNTIYSYSYGTDEREGENHSINNVNFPVVPANAFNASAQAFKFPQDNRWEDDHYADG